MGQPAQASGMVRRWIMPNDLKTHQPSPRPLRYLHRSGPPTEGRAAGQEGCSHRRTKEGTTEVGGQPIPSSPVTEFRREILPSLAKVTLAEIMAAAGISKAFASQVRSGKSPLTYRPGPL